MPRKSKNPRKNWLIGELESLLEQSDVHEVTKLLAEHCSYTAEFIRQHWPEDEQHARKWDRAAAVLETAAERDALKDLRN